MDGKEKIHNISFENENFAAYLVGASRSGKSTLLHTLIAGIIRNYHPDNVELWLADFKQLEFKRYMDHLPPHVKYVLLDESEELVFDLIDRLTNEMLERQRLFSRMGKQRIDQVDTTKLEKPLPVIFVILDEFSIMSQSIAESPSYKLKLQNLLAKGAALGIKFLFSSQTFTTGVSGLTSTARAQIQQRISMKGAREEISETLELSSNLRTDQVKNWMDALPPHYALVKYRIGPDTPPQVKRFLVLYFKDYNVRDEMIDALNQGMKKTEEYIPNDINSYVDKKPVLVDGNTFDAFDWTELSKLAKNAVKDRGEAGNEMLVSFGTPRLMSRVRFTGITNETRENILLVARLQEQQCAASIILSTIKSYQNQKGSVEIWAYSKNTLYKEFKTVFENTGAKIVEDIDAVCDSIRELKRRIKEKQAANTLIVLVGMDRICTDFDFVDDGDAESGDGAKISVAEQRQQLEQSVAAVKTDEQEALHAYAMAWNKERGIIKARLEKEGKNAEEIKALLKESQNAFKKNYYASLSAVPQLSEPSQPQIQITQKIESKPEKMPEQNKTGAYKAQGDFEYIVKQGSRLGYHFMLCINDYSDLKQCGFRNPDLFRYRLAFQLSVQDSRDLFNNKSASTLPEHICKYDNRLEQYSFRPYLHKGIGWDGWFVNEDGSVFNPYSAIDN
jgi:energy-coupling factor transporter ATP-binding protein EcfA2